MLSFAKTALGLSAVLGESTCFLTPMSIKAAFSCPSAKISQLQIKNSEKNYHMCIFPITVDNKTEEKNASATYATVVLE